MAFVEYNQDNIFKKILEGKIPCYKIFETEHVIAILDAFPLVPGHALLIPKAEYATVLDMPAEVAAQVFSELPRLAKAVQAATGCNGINVIQNNGAASGQAVFHTHIHVIPRFDDDGVLKLPAGKEMIQKDAAIAMVTKIQSSL